MRYKNYLFISLLILGLIFLSGLAHYKNNERKIGQIIIDFKNDGTGFISPDIVNKLLIQKKGELPWEAKDSLDLNMLENQTLSSAEEVIIEARISKTKRAMVMPGDFIGISKPIKLEASNYLLLKINSIVTEE